MLFFEAWANLFLFFVYETRFFFVCFCFLKLRQTAEIVNDMTCATVLASLSKHALASSRELDEERLKGIQAYVKLKINYLPRKELFWVLSFRYLLFMNSCHKSLIICDATDSLTISLF